ncbi:MAG: 4Fe-4S dicluster domain-containing protein, partial [bacterium]
MSAEEVSTMEGAEPGDATRTEDLARISRRDFLQKSGVAAVGSVLSFGAIGLIVPDDAEGVETPYDWTKHRWVYLIDTYKCIGCGLCVRACRRENDVPEGMYRTWIERYQIPLEGEAHVDSPQGGEFGFRSSTTGLKLRKSYFVPKMCNHCRATPCTQVCPVGASY